MNDEESARWRPQLRGWSADILPFYARMAEELPDRAVVVEIGVAWGRSLVFLAQELLRLRKDGVALYGVDPWPGESYEQALRSVLRHATIEELSLLRLLRTTSAAAARTFELRSVDFVFIDGLHDEASVTADIATWLPKMRQGAWIAGHDYGTAAHPGVKVAVDRIFGAPDRVDGLCWQRRIA